MKNSLALAMGLLLPVVALAGDWKRDYADALKTAKAQDKPVLVYFHDGDFEKVSAKFNGKEKLADRFVMVRADKETPEGKKLFDLFEIPSDNAAVVVERDQAWQFCRYERELSSKELETVLQKASGAKGVPSQDVLVVEPASEVIVQPSESVEILSPSTGSYCPNCRRR